MIGAEKREKQVGGGVVPHLKLEWEMCLIVGI